MSATRVYEYVRVGTAACEGRSNDRSGWLSCLSLPEHEEQRTWIVLSASMIENYVLICSSHAAWVWRRRCRSQDATPEDDFVSPTSAVRERLFETKSLMLPFFLRTFHETHADWRPGQYKLRPTLDSAIIIAISGAILASPTSQSSHVSRWLFSRLSQSSLTWLLTNFRGCSRSRDFNCSHWRSLMRATLYSIVFFTDIEHKIIWLHYIIWWLLHMEKVNMSGFCVCPLNGNDNSDQNRKETIGQYVASARKWQHYWHVGH